MKYISLMQIWIAAGYITSNGPKARYVKYVMSISFMDHICISK